MPLSDPQSLEETLKPLIPDCGLTCDHNYHKAEADLTKRLADLSITVTRWFNYEADSFGPLVRGCHIRSTHPLVPSGHYYYG